MRLLTALIVLGLLLGTHPATSTGQKDAGKRVK
jgi:hypothetical protein